MANQLDPKRLERTIQHLLDYCIDEGLIPPVVDPVEVGSIVAQYQGFAEVEPFVPVVEPEPEPELVAVPFVERRKSLSVS